MIYAISTLVVLVSDGISFFFAVSRLSNDQDEFSFAGVCLLALCGLYFTVEFYYIMWITSQHLKLPSPIGKATIIALLGISSQMNQALGVENTKTVKTAKQTKKEAGSEEKHEVKAAKKAKSKN